MKFEIKSRWTGSVLFSLETESLKLCVEEGVKQQADLGGANLRGADLYEANLRGANLYGANLRGASLYGADLGEADLGGASLYGADLGEADLRGANLRGANLRRADLYEANLGEADLRGANLYGANLRGANLRGANLGGAKLLGLPIIVGPIGSRQDSLFLWPSETEVVVTTGCFHGSVEKFLNQVQETHKDNQHAIDYKSAIEFGSAMLTRKYPQLLTVKEGVPCQTTEQ